MQDKKYKNEKIKELNGLVTQLYNEPSKRRSLDIGINIANMLLSIMGVPSNELKEEDDVLNDAFPNSKFKNQKMEKWFESHPRFGTARVALEQYNLGSIPVESNFYQLNESATKARISSITQITQNWEDSELTMLPNYNVGIDFFLYSKGDAILMVVSHKSDLRVIEIEEELSNTQIEIFNNIEGCFNYDGINPKTGDMEEFEPQRTIHKTLWNALEVQEVNKKFYIGVSDKFEELVQHIKKYKPEGIESKEIDKTSKIFSSRLIGRIIFLWFLRKKQIIKEENEYFNTNELDSTTYYEKKLKPLFFKTLNTPVDERDGDDQSTPYLNGGLFEAHKNDLTDKSVLFPENWFQEFYAHLNRFNFTTDESGPEFEFIAIDPEMLGRVFENLLASIVPETEHQANDRNKKGAFYTPREIVTLMSKESLKEYLKSKVKNTKYHQGIDSLIDMSDAKFIDQKSTGVLEIWGKQTKEVQSELINAINEYKVLDPACGSGAFPMGMLNLLLKTLQRLSAVYDSKLDKHRLAKSSESFNLYNSKLFIINKVLHGVDIEPMAIEISRLRAWLSLIIDSREEYELEPLPNLEFNFICANSLIPLETSHQISLFEDPDVHERLLKIKDEFFDAKSLTEKKKVKEKFNEIYSGKIDEMEDSKRVKQLKSWHPFETDSPAQFFDNKMMFSVDKFDLVIGNPPYIHFEKMKTTDRNLYKNLNYKTYTSRGDIYTLFYELGVNSLKEGGILTYITSNKWMKTEYGKELRKYLLINSWPKLILNLGSNVFKSASVDTNILLVQKQKINKKTRAVIVNKCEKTQKLSDLLKDYIEIEFKKNQPWAILNNIEQSIKNKIELKGRPLKNWDNIKINRGILTGLNEAFIIDEQTKNEILSNCDTEEEKQRTTELIKPIIKGKHIKRDSYVDAGLYLIVAHNGYQKNSGQKVERVNIEEYPSVRSYLDNYYDQLKKRTDKGDTPYNLRNCAYLEEFKKNKTIWPDISSKPTFFNTSKEIYILNTGYILTNGPIWLSQFLNSKIIEWYFPKIASDLGGKGYRYIKQFIEKIPVPEHYFEDQMYQYYGFTKEEINCIENY